MSVLAAFMVPHPPMIVPEVGRGSEKQVLETSLAYERVAAEVAALTALVDDLCLGYKLPGAGGGGFLYMVAKDPEAAARIKTVLNENRLAPNARFVDMTLSKTGLQISRS